MTHLKSVLFFACSLAVFTADAQTLTSGLVSYYKEDNSNQHSDAVGTSPGAVVSGSPEFVTGKLGSAFKFSGADDPGDPRVQSTIANVTTWQGGTVSVWVKPTIYDGGNLQTVFQFQERDGYGHIHGSIHPTSKQFVFQVGTGSEMVPVTSTTTLADGTWYFVTAAWDKRTNTATLYLNGKQEASSAISSWGTVTDNFYWGAGFNGFGMQGVIDEIGIWNRPLTPDEITSLNNGGSGLAFPFGPSSVSQTEPCLIFVHGSRDADQALGYGTDWTGQWMAGRDYWRSHTEVGFIPLSLTDVLESDPEADFVWAATDGFRRPYFVARYNGASPYWGSEAAGLVARQIVMATDGLPDFGGNSCNTRDGRLTTKFWVIAHSNGANVMDYILGNSRPEDPQYKRSCTVRYDGQPDSCGSTEPFDVVAAKIEGVVSVGGAHRGSALADYLCGSKEPDGALNAAFNSSGQKCTDARLWLQSDSSFQVANLMNAPAKPIWLIAGYSGEPLTSSYLPGNDDGVLQFASTLACAGDPLEAYRLSVCSDAEKMKSNFFNLDISTETHDDERNNRKPGDRSRWEIIGNFYLPSPIAESSASRIDRFLKERQGK